MNPGRFKAWRDGIVIGSTEEQVEIPTVEPRWKVERPLQEPVVLRDWYEVHVPADLDSSAPRYFNGIQEQAIQ